jgi:hypothetical protein
MPLRPLPATGGGTVSTFADQEYREQEGKSMPTRSDADDHGAAAPLGIDTSQPNIARVYDYWLGGKDHFAADRAEADRLLQIFPLLPELAKENRQFQTRAVTWLAGQGIRQFLDIGSGLPTAENNTHEVAQAVAEVGQAAVDIGRHIRQQAGKLRQQPCADEVRSLALDQLGDARVAGCRQRDYEVQSADPHGPDRRLVMFQEPTCGRPDSRSRRRGRPVFAAEER